jgi:hypothetical protein
MQTAFPKAEPVKRRPEQSYSGCVRHLRVSAKEPKATFQIGLAFALASESATTLGSRHDGQGLSPPGHLGVAAANDWLTASRPSGRSNGPAPSLRQLGAAPFT